MNLYLGVWILICMFGIKDLVIKTPNIIKKYEFQLLFVILSLMLMFRFGQGTDFFAYRYIYYFLSDYKFDFSQYTTLHCEFGYLLICNLFRYIGAPFEVFIAITAIIEMVCFYRFTKYFNLNTPYVFVLLYPTLYMTYFFSAIRQGIVIAIFLGVLLPCIFEKKYKLYITISLLCSLIHGTAIIFLLGLVTKKIQNIYLMQIFCFASWVGGVTLLTPMVSNLVISLGIQSINNYMFKGSEILILSILERLFFVTLLTYFYLEMRKTNQLTETYKIMYLIYLIAMATYGFFMGFNNIASRLGGVMRFVELYLIMYAMHNMKINTKNIFICFFVIFESVMLFKNVEAYIEQGNYISNVNVFSYEYVSIFDEDDIYKIRRINSAFILK